MTRHHFYSLTDHPGKAIRRALAHGLVTLWLATHGAWLPSVSLADNVSLPDLRDLTLTNWDCLAKREGIPRDAAGASRNRMKNRDWIAAPATNIPQWDYAQFVEHARAFDAELGAISRSNLTHEAEAKLAAIQTQIVSVTGWVVLAYASHSESCNCNSEEFRDWHIELVPKPFDHAPQIGDLTAIICEVTPRTEAVLYRAGIRLQKLAAFINLGKQPNVVAHPTGSAPHQVRVTGYLMWDDEHTKPGKDTGPTIERSGQSYYHHPYRASAWEIHPILKIDDLGPAK